jgi:hypothetical protein
MCLHIETVYEQNQIITACSICGYHSGGRFSPPLRYRLMDEEDYIGDVCERCAFGDAGLWRAALMGYAARLETKASLLRDLSSRLSDAQPALEGIAEDILRQNMNKPAQRPGGLFGPRPPFD